ncbi:hypothetical protein CRUP_037645 [Coryphaenoides rupestris]|nr:hypothetical protein CRUP_037645 [Coryphaenoides rupestris]
MRDGGPSAEHRSSARDRGSLPLPPSSVPLMRQLIGSTVAPLEVLDGELGRVPVQDQPAQEGPVHVLLAAVKLHHLAGPVCPQDLLVGPRRDEGGQRGLEAPQSVLQWLLLPCNWRRDGIFEAQSQ